MEEKNNIDIETKEINSKEYKKRISIAPFRTMLLVITIGVVILVIGNAIYKTFLINENEICNTTQNQNTEVKVQDLINSIDAAKPVIYI